MKNVTEASRWLRDAEACLHSAQRALDVQDYRVVVQNAQLCGEEMLASLGQLAEDAQEAAPWHGWSTYGRELEDKGWVAAVDLSTETVASDFLQRAQRSLQTAQSWVTLLSTSPSAEE